MAAVLEREGLTFGHVVRQWGYIEGMLDVCSTGSGERQGYQAFNDVRTLAYARSGFPAGYPAATGIGQATGGVVLEFLALDAPDDVRVSPISNPKQVDAHRYSDGVLIGESLEDLSGKSPPKFERAKRVARGEAETVFVSGTASIRGEESVAVGDVAAQTRTTIDNIAALVGGRLLSRLRAYVKRSGDIPVVRSVCEDAYGTIPALYVQADVCRDELLVELEGAVVVRPSLSSGGTEVRR
jgi:enamine deaminase RidA (YjgF/YER057c/UK114 family)